jgi:hypothetical protein
MKTIKGFTVLDNIPRGWSIVRGATTAPNGYVIISNNKSRFFGKRETAISETGKLLNKTKNL